MTLLADDSADRAQGVVTGGKLVLLLDHSHRNLVPDAGSIDSALFDEDGDTGAGLAVEKRIVDDHCRALSVKVQTVRHQVGADPASDEIGYSTTAELVPMHHHH